MSDFNMSEYYSEQGELVTEQLLGSPRLVKWDIFEWGRYLLWDCRTKEVVALPREAPSYAVPMSAQPPLILEWDGTASRYVAMRGEDGQLTLTEAVGAVVSQTWDFLIDRPESYLLIFIGTPNKEHPYHAEAEGAIILTSTIIGLYDKLPVALRAARTFGAGTMLDLSLPFPFGGQPEPDAD